MGATAAIVAIMAAASTYQTIASNQQTQHAKGAAQAQQTSMDAQVAQEQKRLEDQSKTSADATGAVAAQQTAMTGAGETQTNEQARARAKVSGSNTLASTILTSPLGAQPAMTFGKTLLGA